MLRTEEIRGILKETGKPMDFNTIWKKVGPAVMESVKDGLDEDRVKSDLFFSLMEDSRIIMIGNEMWDLRSKYSLANQNIIQKARMTEEAELVWEESAETKELNLRIIKNDDTKNS